MSKFKTKGFKPGRFVGSFYSRGGHQTDKYGNVSFKPTTFRNNHSGIVVSAKGKILGIERNRRHSFGNDPRKIKVTKSQTAQKKKIMLELRKRGKI